MADIQFADFGNALSAGAAAGAHSAAAARARREDEASIAAKPLIKPALGGDVNAQNDLLAADPKTAAVVYQALSRMDANKQAHAKTAADYTVNATTGILGAPPADRPRLYAMTLEDAKAKGIDTSTWPAQYDEGFVRFNHTRGVGAKAFFEEQGKKERHQPGGGGGPTQLDMPGGGGMPTPGPRPAGPAMSEAPAAPGPVIAQAPSAQPAPTQIAQAPTQIPDGIPTAPPHIAQGDETRRPLADGSGNPLPPQDQPRARPTGSIWSEDPTKYGLVMRGERDKYGNVKPVDVGGHFLFRDPKTNEHVLYKPRAEVPAERPQPPPSMRWGPLGADGQPTQEFIPGGLQDPAVIARRTEATRKAEEKAIPQSVTKGIQDNLANLKQVDKALAAVDKNPDSVGGWGSNIASVVPGASNLQNRIDKEGVDVRSLIANIGSLIIHDRSGAAVTAAEQPRLRPFIPSIGDSPETIKKQLGLFKQNYEAILNDTLEYYGPANGFREYTPATKHLSGGKEAPKAPGGAEQSKALFEARDAISKGVPKDVVIERLQKNGIDSSGL